jgi:hypothetical protein
MAFDSENKSSAELQRELEQQRSRVENTIDEIQQKLSPGQLVDELLAYTKGGGGEFVSSLQRNIVANPLPVALLGVSLAWLMAKPAPSPADDSGADYAAGAGEDYDDFDYPVATISGSSLQRVGQIGEDRDRYSEFIDDAGKKFRARSDAQGRRAGHFVDEAGNRFKGFADSAGQRIHQIRDETGNLLDEASGWASHTWQMAREKMHDARETLHAGQSRVGAAGMGAMNRVGSLNETILHQFRDQPLVGGALAFALGAALGSTLPHTPQEDAVMGEAADTFKDKATAQAAELYEEGKEAVASAHEAVTEKAGAIYQQVKDGASQSSDDGRT